MPNSKENRRVGFRTETASGLPDSLIIDVKEAWFARDPRYNSGKTLCLLLKGDLEEVMAGGEEVDYDIEENPIMFPCGDGWDTFDSGETAEHERGRKVFTDRSAAGILLDRACEVLGIEDDLAANSKSESGTEAGIWVGFKLLLEREEFDYGKNKQGQEMKTSRLMPTKVLGKPGDSGSKKSSSKKSSAAASTKATKTKAAEPEDDGGSDEGSGVLANIDSKLAMKLKVAFKKADGDPQKFSDLAIDIDGVADDDDLVNAVADNSLFEALSE